MDVVRGLAPYLNHGCDQILAQYRGDVVRGPGAVVKAAWKSEDCELKPHYGLQVSKTHNVFSPQYCGEPL